MLQLRCCSSTLSSARLVSYSIRASSSARWFPNNSTSYNSAATARAVAILGSPNRMHGFSSSSSSAAAAAASSSSSSPAAATTTTTTTSSQLIKELRVMSGAPMVECKKALEHAGVDGDLTKAMDWLREHGAAKTSGKLRGRDAPEGLVAVRISDDGTRAALIKVNSETDFAGRSPTFLQLIDHVANATLLLPSNQIGPLDEETLLAASFQSKSVRDVLNETIVSIRENLRLSQAIRFHVNHNNNSNNDNDNSTPVPSAGRLIGYVHGRVDVNYEAGTVAAIVQLQPKDTTKNAIFVWEPQWQEVGKKLAMHVVAAKPLFLNPPSVPPDVLDKERSILTKQLEDSNKPRDVIDKIVTGRMRKFYEESCLTEQLHMVEEGNPKVSKVLDGAGLTVTQFMSLSIAP